MSEIFISGPLLVITLIYIYYNGWIEYQMAVVKIGVACTIIGLAIPFLFFYPVIGVLAVIGFLSALFTAL